MGIANNDYVVAPVANSVLKRMIDRKKVDPAKIRTIYKSQTFPTTGYGHAHNLHPEVAAKVKQAFFTFPWEGSDLQKEFKYCLMIPIMDGNRIETCLDRVRTSLKYGVA